MFDVYWRTNSHWTPFNCHLKTIIRLFSSRKYLANIRTRLKKHFLLSHFRLVGALSICMEKLVRIFHQMEQCVWKKTPAVPLWNQMERFFPLVILGNKPRISPSFMVSACDRGKWLSNIPVISVKTGKKEYVKSYSFFLRKSRSLLGFTPVFFFRAPQWYDLAAHAPLSNLHLLRKSLPAIN